MNQEIIDAIENQNIIEFNYGDEVRVVEPHCYGKTIAGNEGLRAFQIDGYSSTGKSGWKMYDLGKVDDITITEDLFDEPRPGYQRGDKGMSEIYAEL
ncbi:hypothetical protein [Chryseobacterium populi]|uniref:WYL domain-containing protein n=1 Tax=Chryseobacterium populi TaxID=1144316 RepID=J2SYI5_9FLAO|nr:hypothetical protein [Chryseobacterium populi]EJL70722.1 hypothetical protein PMI13_02725 [Chryseobacterium populi]